MPGALNLIAVGHIVGGAGRKRCSFRLPPTQPAFV
jgi:hypothetical protein